MGALEKMGKKLLFHVIIHSLIAGRFRILIEKTDKRFDIIGHGKTDVYYDEVTFSHKEKFRGVHKLPLQGTSFAAPKALVRDFSNRIY